MKTFTKAATLGVLAGLLLAVPSFAQTAGADEPQTAGISETVAVGPETVLVAGGGDSCARGGGERCGRDGKHGGCMNLSDDQLEKMNALKLAMQASTANERAELHTLHAQLMDAMTKPTIDRGAVTALQTKINSLHDDLAMKMLNYRLDKASLLTPEQRHDLRHRMLMHSACGGGHRWGHHGHHG